MFRQENKKNTNNVSKLETLPSITKKEEFRGVIRRTIGYN